MSGDLEQAIACGATHVRVGTAVLGNRPTAPVVSDRSRCTVAGTETRRTEVMSGAMRKMGVYLGLLEDADRYDEDYVRRAESRRGRGRRARRASPTGRRRAGEVAERRRPAARPSAGPRVAELSRITTLHPTHLQRGPGHR